MRRVDVSVWREVGERVFVRRYEVFDQSIGAIEGDDGYLIVDTNRRTATGPLDRRRTFG